MTQLVHVSFVVLNYFSLLRVSSLCGWGGRAAEVWHSCWNTEIVRIHVGIPNMDANYFLLVQFELLANMEKIGIL